MLFCLNFAHRFQTVGSSHVWSDGYCHPTSAQGGSSLERPNSWGSYAPSIGWKPTWCPSAEHSLLSSLRRSWWREEPAGLRTKLKTKNIAHKSLTRHCNQQWWHTRQAASEPGSKYGIPAEFNWMHVSFNRRCQKYERSVRFSYTFNNPTVC